MTIILYQSVVKRPNSTKVPDPSEGLSVTGEIKEETSFLQPVIRFSKNIVSGVFTPNAFNYAQIPYWQRYYYIIDWRFCNGYWECYLTVDVMASFKAEIAATSAYVTRSASEMNTSIPDGRYPTKTNVAITKVALASAWNGVAPSGGSYVIGVINHTAGNKIGTLNYYALTIAQLGSLMSFLYGSGIYQASNISEISEGLFKSMFNPAQYIVSCMWFPFAPSAFGSNTANITVGYWDTGVSGAVIMTALAELTHITGTIPLHPQKTRGLYLNTEPYTRVNLYIPPFGSIPLNMNFINAGRYIYAPVYVDHVTGLATIRISLCQSASQLDDGNIACERTAQIGVPVSLSQVMPDYLGSLQSIGSGAVSLLTGNLIGAANGLLSYINHQMPTVTTIGANGSTIETIIPPYMIVEHILLADENRDEFGRPLCATRTLGQLSGYIECGDGDHEFSATPVEKEQINNYLHSGFFYE